MKQHRIMELGTVKLWVSLLIMISTSNLTFAEAIQQNGLITQLPGFSGSFPSKHYSGYVNIDEKNLFYYFVVSERNPEKDPLVLWLNGGPGCSSFDGFVYEHGPFNFELPKKKGDLPTLKLNPYSWSKVSNIIYLDSPAGVGFSYSNNKSDYSTGDLQTAADTSVFLLKWLELYPEFNNNPFYITGESYAGIYVPTLASQILKGIRSGAKPVINFKGYMIGNGVTGSQYDDSLLPFVHGMGLISEKMFQDAQAACGDQNQNQTSPNCETATSKIYKALSGLNVYNTLEPCFHYPEQNKLSNLSLPESFKNLGKTERPMAVRKRMFGRAWPLMAAGVKDGIVPLWSQLDQQNEFHVPCVNDEAATVWLNDKAVRDAIHARPVAGEWAICSQYLSYNHDAGDMLPIHVNLTSLGYRALIYSGDHDMCVPFTGSEAWTTSLGYKIVDEWRQWLLDDQIAGYLQGYEHNLTFLTIKGAGHTVPEYKPKEALAFFTRWLDGKPI